MTVDLATLSKRAQCGESVRKLAREAGISNSTFRRRLNAFEVGGVQPLGPDLGAAGRVPDADPLLAALQRAHP